MERNEGSVIPLQVSRGCVVASIQVDLTDEVLRRFRDELLARVQSSGADGIILDLSGIEVLDDADFEALHRTMTMGRLMGARTVVCGLRAGVVAALVELGCETEDIVASYNLDDAFAMM